MRLAWYVRVSVALAGVVVLSAFHQRANFYSAMVHLAQSSLSVMILVNLVFIVYSSFMYGLQRLCFGQLRPVEIEQLYERGWFAVTETCLAMTIFREEIGPFFLIMFTALVTGKVWGWIGEGRVEVLEQQPPANQWLFHTRLSVSLLLSVLYDMWLLSYSVQTVVRQARPTMMVMFLFEFAVLLVSSCHTGVRYLVSLAEQRIVQAQTRQRMAQRREEIRYQRAGLVPVEQGEALPNEDDVEEIDIEVPGWESKGQWVLSLDLAADFLKLCIYTSFFLTLFTFYGLPIHILRDLFMTIRSFFKRLEALLRYRRAVRDMAQYPDATAEELAQENTCIICREDMRPWDATPHRVERSRPKKLPCGHILHLGCLKSWLERQQVCPTCRRSVSARAPGQEQAAPRNHEPLALRFGLNLPGGANQQQPPAQLDGQGAAPAPAPADANGGQGPQGDGQDAQANNRNGVRMFNFGPIRIGFAQGVQDIQAMARGLGLPGNVANPGANQPPVTPAAQPQVDASALSLDQLRVAVLEASQRALQDLDAANFAAYEMQLLGTVLAELHRLRTLPTERGGVGSLQSLQTGLPDGASAQTGTAAGIPSRGVPPLQPMMMPNLNYELPPLIPLRDDARALFRNPPNVTRHGGVGAAIPSGSAELPEGVSIPPGWSLLPLRRLDGGADAAGAAASSSPADVPDWLSAELASLAQGGDRPGTSSSTSPAPHNNTLEGALSHLLATTERLAAQPPTVTAPTPVAPNLAGSSVIGDNSGNSNNADGLTSGDAAAGGGPKTAPASNSTADAAGPSSGDGGATNGDSSGDRAQTRAVPVAVTVEDADDDDDNANL